MKNLIFTFLTLMFVSTLFAQEGGFHLDKEYTINKSGMIDLSSSDAKVFITGSTRSTAHVKIDRIITSKGWTWGGENFRVEVAEENGNLSRVSVIG